MRDWSKYIGIPFVDGGRDFSGCDCYGLVRLALMQEYGVVWPLLSGAYDDTRNHGAVAAVLEAWKPLLAGRRLPCPEEAAVAVVTVEGAPSHIGLYAGDGLILHAWGTKTGSVLQRADHAFFKGRIEGYYRVR